MKSFKFQQFELKQSREVFRIGTDAVLLGALANLKDAKNVLEIGTGSGIISLMLAQRFLDVNILALDINHDAVVLANDNFSNSIFSRRIKAIHHDFKTFKSENLLDAIVTNPPFFEINDSSKDVLARQKLELNFEDIVSNASRLLTENGILSVIIPSLEKEVFQDLAANYTLNLVREINIKGIENGELKRVILEFSPRQDLLIVEDFIIEKAPRVYSDQYLELTKDFHVFKNK